MILFLVVTYIMLVNNERVDPCQFVFRRDFLDYICFIVVVAIGWHKMCDVSVQIRLLDS